MDFIVQLVALLGATLGVDIVIRKERRDAEKHRWEREDRAKREL